MATTFTDNYQIKLIGTGLEAGTWGTSTNENLKRIEQALGGSSTVDVDLPGGTSTYTTGVLEWCTADTVAAGVAGSEGRDCFVEFTSATQATKVKVRGPAGGDYTERVFFVYNNSGHTLTFNSHSGTTYEYAVLDGSYAVICTQGSTGLKNILSKLQIDNLVFSGEADIVLPDGTANALEIADVSATKYLTVDTSTNVVELNTASVITGTGLAQSVIKSSGNQDLKLETGHLTTGSISIVDGVGGNISITPDAAGKLIVGNGSNAATITTGGSQDLVLNTDSGTDSGSITITDDADQNILIAPDGSGKVIVGNSGATGKISTGGAQNLVLDTNNNAGAGAEVIVGDGTNGGISLTPAGTGAVTIATDAVISGTDGYIAFNTLAGTPSDSYGIRNSSGRVQSKSNGGAWGGIYSSNQVTGDGTYFELSGIALPVGYGTVTKPHGFSTVPRIFQVNFVNESTDAEWDPGDEVPAGNIMGSAESDQGVTYGADGTNVFVAVGNALWILRKEGADKGKSVEIDRGDWTFTIRAWK
jgi:hypothetical protein